MDTRKRRVRSSPIGGLEYTIKKDLPQRKTCPRCPPLSAKGNKLTPQEGLFYEKTPAKAVFVNQPINLSQLYSPERQQSYFDQIFAENSIIGEGSFGVVFKVRSREDDNLYAVKQFKSLHNLHYGYAEVENYEKIGEHSNCVRFVMAWEELKIVHIQMEFCNLSLAQYATITSKIQENQLWEILYDMLKALDYLHTKNLIHLDVKPGNIMMSNGFYKLADFGLLVDLNKHDGRKISTISDGDAKYLACEVLEGIYTYSCDIFGLGISLLELATNIELPTFGPLWHQIRKQYLPSVFYEGVTQSFAIIIEQMMSSSHCERPQASMLLSMNQLRKVQKEDLKKPRNNYSQELPEESYALANCNNNNNNIIETPRRPLFDIHHGSRQNDSGRCLQASGAKSSSSVEGRRSPAIAMSRRDLFRVKLNF